MTNVNRLQRFGFRFISGFWGEVKENPELFGARPPLVTWSFTRFDPEVGECYDTTRGDTVIGNEADKGQKAKGLHIAWVLVPIGLVIAGVFLTPAGVKIYAQSLFRSIWPSQLQTTNTMQAILQNTQTPAPTSTSNAPPRLHTQNITHLMPVLPKKLRSVSISQGHKIFLTEDGKFMDNPVGTWDGRTLKLITGETFIYER